MFRSLDYLYIPSKDVEADVQYYCDVLGGKAVFKIKDGGTTVACVKLSETGPHLLFASHLYGSLPILIYRVDSVKDVQGQIEPDGWKAEGHLLEIPHGPCLSFVARGGQRIAIYQLDRPQALTWFDDRFDQ